ncbi:DUF1534 domain-containing protein [Pseudomonas congelans]|nr:DUF1534 domain-containing protein [Pseudomonas congelans]
MGDAMRHRSAPRRMFRIGRGASERHADAERRHDSQSEEPQRRTSSTPDSMWWVYGN